MMPIEIFKNFSRGPCPRSDCRGTLYAQPSVDLSCWLYDQCEMCGATWFNNHPRNWPPDDCQGEGVPHA